MREDRKGCTNMLHASRQVVDRCTAPRAHAKRYTHKNTHNNMPPRSLDTLQHPYYNKLHIYTLILAHTHSTPSTSGARHSRSRHRAHALSESAIHAARHLRLLSMQYVT